MVKIDEKFLVVAMPDGSRWAVPVKVIAESRAREYAKQDEVEFARSYAEDTIPLFEESPYDIGDWASNNINWEDVKKHAVKIGSHPMTDRDFQEGWVNGGKEILDSIPEEANGV
jgi:hypothetical protein